MSREKGDERSAARLAAVQALYQMDIGGAAAERVIEEFLLHRRGETIDETIPVVFAAERFAEIVRGAAARLDEVDGLIAGGLAKSWDFERLELPLRAVLRAGCYELLACSEVPARVVIDEYVEVAHAFFGRGEPGLVNGLLDRLARELRPAEFSDGAG